MGIIIVSLLLGYVLRLRVIVLSCPFEWQIGITARFYYVFCRMCGMRVYICARTYIHIYNVQYIIHTHTQPNATAEALWNRAANEFNRRTND